MEIRKAAVCGTLESGDVQVTIRPNEGQGVVIELESVVKAAFGDAITATVQEVLDLLAVRDVQVSLIDKGALDAVIRSRMTAAVMRAAGEKYDWSKEMVM